MGAAPRPAYRLYTVTGMLHPCRTEGCETWTLGGFCLEHDQPAAVSLQARGNRPALHAVVSSFGTNRADDACGPHDPRFSTSLASCVGFRVITPHGRLGEVERLGSRNGNAQALLIRAGLFRRNLIEVPVEMIEWIVPSGRRIFISKQPAPAERAR
jgi:hypothetical protein